MNWDLLRSAGIDCDRGIGRFMGRAQMYEKVLGKFLKDTAFARVRADWAAGDRAQLLMDAHELKGVCANLALTRLYGAAQEMVALLRAGESGEALNRQYALLESTYRATREAVINAAEDGQ